MIKININNGEFIPLTLADNADREGDIRNEVPEPISSTVDSPAIQDSSMTATTINTVSQKKNVSLSGVEDILHHALDAASGDEMTSAFSGNGEGEEVSISEKYVSHSIYQVFLDFLMLRGANIFTRISTAALI